MMVMVMMMMLLLLVLIFEQMTNLRGYRKGMLVKMFLWLLVSVGDDSYTMGLMNSNMMFQQKLSKNIAKIIKNSFKRHLKLNLTLSP